MGANGFARRIEEPRAQRRVNTGDDLIDIRDPLLHELGDLAMAPFAVREVLVDDRQRVIDGRPMGGEQTRRTKAADPAQRRKVLAQVSAAARRDDDRAAETQEVAAINLVRALIEKTEMIRRMTRRVQRPQLGAAGGEEISVLERRPLAAADDDGRPALPDVGDTRNMIDVAVRHEHESKRAAGQPALDGVEMLTLPDAGIDEHRGGLREQKRIVARGTRPLRGIPGRDRDRHLPVILQSEVQEVTIPKPRDRVRSLAGQPAS